MPLIVIVYTAYNLLIICSDQELSKFGIKGWWMFTRDRVMEEVYEGNRDLNRAIIQFFHGRNGEFHVHSLYQLYGLWNPRV